VESTKNHNWRALGRVGASMAAAAIAFVLWSGTSSAAPTDQPPPPTPTSDLLAFLDQLGGVVTTTVVDPLVEPVGLPPVDLSLEPALEPVVAPVVDPLVNEVVVPTLDGLTGTVGEILAPVPPVPGVPLPPVPPGPPVIDLGPTTPGAPAPVPGSPSAGRATTTDAGAVPTGAASPTVGSGTSGLLRFVGTDATITGAVDGTDTTTSGASGSGVPFAPTGSSLPGGFLPSPDLASGAVGLLLIAVLAGAAALLGPSVGRRLRTTRLLSPRQLAALVPTSPD
jgi:hypothetical protein